MWDCDRDAVPHATVIPAQAGTHNPERPQERGLQRQPCLPRGLLEYGSPRYASALPSGSRG